MNYVSIVAGMDIEGRGALLSITRHDLQMELEVITPLKSTWRSHGLTMKKQSPLGLVIGRWSNAAIIDRRRCKRADWVIH